MSKKNIKPLLPKFRFPEFQNSGEWDYPNGNKLFEPIVNKDHNSDLPILAISQDYGAIPRDMIDYHISVTEKSIESYKVVEIGDFIISLRSFQGGIEYSAYKGICSPAYIILRKKFDKIENHFYRFYFKSISFIKELNKNIEGIRDGKMVSYTQFSELNLPFPDYSEQQKIADCLTSLDELISTELDKLEAYKAQKKGLMQKLFPAEGETLPEWRFPEFQGKGEWEEKRLGDVTENVMYGMNAPSIEFDGKNKYIRITDIDEDTRLFSPNQLTSPKGSLEDKYMVNIGDVLFARTGASVGKSYLHQSKNEKIYFAGFLIRFSITEAIPYFVYTQTLTLKFQQWVAVTSIRSGQPGINAEEYKSFSICIPPDNEKHEQKKIVDCLTSLDALIIAQTQKIEALKTHKRSLMQGLFPSADEVGV
ncbi:restriction endonuclease subunit S [Marispirochaeta aestuarii]|uniref:restriction endonuclease subunit S n=1 Tax=Marispirochaeta aestuarii TaxID=1963862 RepID=UPI0029C80130|nr:restriction endonuclease subunit S [Marispirochaeta aestuarii]